MRFSTRPLSRIVFILVLLAPLVLILPPQSNASPTVCGGKTCNLQYNPYPTQYTPTEIFTQTSQACDPQAYFIANVYDEVKISTFEVEKTSYRPGESLTYSGTVQVGEDLLYVNCYGQGYTDTQEVSPTQSAVQVQLLGGKFSLTPSSGGSFSGSYTIPFTEPSGNYTAVATATFRTASDSASASFQVVAYKPILNITYATSANAAFPGENIVLEGDGWIPNMVIAVYVDDNFTTTSDSTGHFTLTIPIPEVQPFQEGIHNITVTQANLIMVQSFTVKYHDLAVALDNLAPVAQGDEFVASGNVTATGTGKTVAAANVTVFFLGKQYSVITGSNGTFKTDPIPTDSSIKPGSYSILANATRSGFRPSQNAVQELTVIPKLNIAEVSVAVVSGVAVGAALALRVKIPKGPSKPPSLTPGTTSQPSVTPGSEQVVAKVGPATRTRIGPGLSKSAQAGDRQIQPGPLIDPRTSEFCIHCGANIARGSKNCPDCGIRLR